MNKSPDPSTSGKSSMRSFIPKLSFKFRNNPSDIEKAATILALGGSSLAAREKPLTSRTMSFTNIFTPRAKRPSSLPVTPIAHSNPESTHGGNSINPHGFSKGEAQLAIHRSHSVPALNKDGSIRQLDSLGGRFRVVPTAPCAAEQSGTKRPNTPRDDMDENDDGGEDIPEEEAFCRICLTELGEGADTLKMECSCKGELALAHQECAVKWFSIKGNKTCDVCKQEVKNLPVTLLCIDSVQSRNSQGSRAWHVVEVPPHRVWQEVPVLVIVSMIAYFGFLEQLLVRNLGSGAMAISLPFSCILGLLASMTSTTMVWRKYVWVYATVQFALVVLFAHLFYSMLLHKQAISSVLLATFTGFGVTMCGNTALSEFFRWRTRWLARVNERRLSRELRQFDQLPATVP
uniref:Protein binding protein n=1 Tax=Rhizophora mucronata TaxID=61149 RepID=A0A2P2M0S5_RHIMU